MVIETKALKSASTYPLQLHPEEVRCAHVPDPAFTWASQVRDPFPSPRLQVFGQTDAAVNVAASKPRTKCMNANMMKAVLNETSRPWLATNLKIDASQSKP